ncbi:MAG TPA: aldo/keto reductase, partial [Candidatus Marinimicrobia bacterium]|nr:aldo/keto reductase [Candidatus Neomarinimicrobiota bacterium]
MDYTLLGTTGVKVSQLCLGTMTFGGPADEKESAKMFNLCRDTGVNFFDCADVYENGRSEEILGKLIAQCREEVIITSKVYFPTGDDVNSRGSTRKHISASVEESLRRLGTDYIDLYFLHRFDDLTSLEETLSVLNDLVRQGKVLYLGASNFAAWQVAKALGISSRQG